MFYYKENHTDEEVTSRAGPLMSNSIFKYMCFSFHYFYLYSMLYTLNAPPKENYEKSTEHTVISHKSYDSAKEGIGPVVFAIHLLWD